MSSKEELCQAARIGSIDVVAWLVDEEGVEVDSLDEYGKTALIHSCKEGHLNVVQVLLYRGANPLIKSKWYEETAFHAAAYGGHLPIVEVLIELCLNPFEKDERGRTPRDLALQFNHHQEVADLLEQYEADFQVEYARCFGLFLQDYNQYKQALQAVHQDRDQARLLQSANEGRADEVEELLRSREVREWNEVVWKGAWMSNGWKGHGDVLRLFVEAGVDVDEERDERGQTLILQAYRQDNPDAVRALCENGADILEEGRYGISPLLSALHRKRKHILAIFRSHVPRNRIFTHPHTDSVPNLNLFVRDKIESQAFLFFGLMHPLSKWEVREYMDVMGCVRNGVRDFVEKYGLEVEENEERRCGLRVIVRAWNFPLDLQRWLLFWVAENAWN